MQQEDESRQKRKEEGRLKKRQRIEESNGVRPRKMNQSAQSKNSNKGDGRRDASFQKRPGSLMSRGHRFGRVMENVPCRKKPRFSTLSIALPGSVLTNCQTKELRTLMVGQIARAATIYHVDEIVVFDDKLGRNMNEMHTGWNRRRDFQKKEPSGGEDNKAEEKQNEEGARRPRSDPHEFMARLLQYCECPQYLRRRFFPMHPDLQFAGLLAPVDAPHHVRAEDHSPYREGVVLDKKPSDPNAGSLVNCGIRNRPVQIDRKLAPGIRCTVQIDSKAYGKPGQIKGTVVSPSAPREADGTYWGYTTRMASSINAVFDECPYEGGYDLKVGTSERGDRSVEEKNFHFPKFEHSLIVFGGVAGIEECVDADESIKLPGSQSKKLFDMWLNTCPYQGSRTIRTEEAVLISLCTLSSALAKSSRDSAVAEEKAVEVDFSDDGVSEESSSGGSDSDSD
eukprot:scaffold1384_cov116-Cylindrotheca_fusiformis.AAC.39